MIKNPLVKKSLIRAMHGLEMVCTYNIMKKALIKRNNEAVQWNMILIKLKPNFLKIDIQQLNLNLL